MTLCLKINPTITSLLYFGLLHLLPSLYHLGILATILFLLSILDRKYLFFLPCISDKYWSLGQFGNIKKKYFTACNHFKERMTKIASNYLNVLYHYFLYLKFLSFCPAHCVADSRIISIPEL